MLVRGSAAKRPTRRDRGPLGFQAVKTRLAAAILVVGGLALLVVFLRTTSTEEFVADGPFDAVEIETDGGDVEVTGTSDPGAVIRRESSRGVRVSEQTAGSLLRLTTACPAIVVVGCQTGYQVEIPAGARLRVTTKGGSVRLAGDLRGSVRVEAGSGEVRLDGLAGTVTARTTSGRVTATGLRSRTVDISSESGAISVAMAADLPPDALLLDSTSGSITALLPDAAYRVAAESAGAVAVEVAVDATSSHVVTARSKAGSVRIQPQGVALPAPGRGPS